MCFYHLFQVFDLTLFEAVIVYFSDTRQLFESDSNPDTVVTDSIGINFNIGKEALFPEFFHNGGKFATRDTNFLTYGKAGESDKDIIFVRFCAGDIYICEGIGTGSDTIIESKALLVIVLRRQRGDKTDKKQK